jgi:hypothetical protein
VEKLLNRSDPERLDPERLDPERLEVPLGRFIRTSHQ